jgi:glycosyltransferase involved in cell wall biosynthesis
MSKISVIIPCYFNEGNIPVTGKELVGNEKNFPAGTEFEYVFVDDGSKDGTLTELLKFKEQYPGKVKVIKLASNAGAFNAILAGFTVASGDCNVVLAADLQDPPDLIPKMFDYWQKGVKLVIANRQDREESFLQKLFSNTYHSLIRKFALKNVPPGGFDLVLFDRQLKVEVIKMNEKNTNILYLLTWLGFDYVNIPYVRKKREIGKSRWTMAKKIKTFIDSFVAFSFFPIRLISIMGFVMGFIAMCYGIFILVARFFNYIHLEGWSSMMVVLLFVSSFQMIALGIIGEYVWRSLDAARSRPNYIIDKYYS